MDFCNCNALWIINWEVCNLNKMRTYLKLRNIAKKSFFLFKKPKTTKFPEIVSIELSTICNAKCIFCPQSKIKRDKVMKEDIFGKIIDECVGHKELKFIKPTLYGEPFVTPNLFKRLRYIRNKLPNVKIKIITNALKMNRNESDKLIKENLCDEINFSIDAAKKETFEYLKKISYDKVIKNINYFLEKNSKIKTFVSFVYTKENSDELREFKKQWKNKVDGFHISTEVGLNRREDYVKETTNLYCSQPFNRLNFISTGEVIMCCTDIFAVQKMGDIKKQTVSEIWDSPQFKMIRGLHLQKRKKEIPICKDCNEWS